MKRNVAHAESEAARRVSGGERGGVVTSIRPYAAADADQVLALVTADRLPGQPEAPGDVHGGACGPVAGRQKLVAGN